MSIESTRNTRFELGAAKETVKDRPNQKPYCRTLVKPKTGITDQ
jgi:hypothetical protein